MQISEMTKAIGPVVSEGQNLSALNKDDATFAQLFEALSRSLQKPLDLSDQSLLEGMEERLAEDTGEEQDLLDLMAMMGQNALVSPVMGSFKKPDQEGLLGLSEGSQIMPGQNVLTEPDQMSDQLVRPLQAGDLERSLATYQSLASDQKSGLAAEPILKQAEGLNLGKDQQKDGGLATKKAMASQEGLGVKESLGVEKSLSVGEDSVPIIQKPEAARANTKADQADQIVASQSKTAQKTNPSLEATTVAGMAKTSPLEALATNQEAGEVSVVKQLEGKILDQFDGKTGKVFKMTLKPDHLGEIDVELKINNGKLVIGILSASQETHELLTRQVDQLVRSLALQKVQVQTIETHRFIEETDQAQGQGNFTSSDFNQNDAQNPYFKGSQKSYQRHFGTMQSGESISDTLTQLSSMSKQFNRLDYRI